MTSNAIKRFSSRALPRHEVHPVQDMNNRHAVGPQIAEDVRGKHQEYSFGRLTGGLCYGLG